MGMTPKALLDGEVLVLDAQTSAATPRKGCLIEVGWAPVVAATGPTSAPQAHLMRLPEGEKLPPAVSKLTGIQPDELISGDTLGDVWGRLSETIGAIRERSGAPCTAVIHYARFEQPFLERWHAECAPHKPFPLEIICTHAIARRLLPDLPRRGLRALAGYFGFAVGPLKRSGPHVAATIVIWKRLVAQLAEAGVRDMESLKQWLQAAPCSHSPSRIYPMPSDRYRQIPDRPGVYRFRRSSGELLYIGKAKSLKRRVGSYFQGRRRHPEHILEMLTQAVDLDYAETGTALEAALREAEEIRELAPVYNQHLLAKALSPVFTSGDFQRTGLAARKGLPMGPFPSQAALAPLATLIRCLSRPSKPVAKAETAILEALGLLPERQPPPGLLCGALDRLRQRQALPQGRKAIGRRLMLCGALWWRMRRGTRQTSPSEAQIESLPDATWTDADMMHFLRGVVCHGAFLARRGHWFTLLCNATLAWENGAPGGRAATLTITDGRMGRVSSLARMGKVARPKRYAVRPCQGMAAFDAASYVRLRVLTTEIKRLVTAGRGVRIGLTPRVELDEIALERLLFWI